VRTRRPGSGHRGLAPLRRKPKHLDAEPTLFDASGAGAGGPTTSGRRPAPVPGRSGGGAAEFTDHDGALAGGATGDVEVDPQVLLRARQIAERLAIPRPRRDHRQRGSGEIATVPYRGGSDELDVDATLDSLAHHPVPGHALLYVRERVRRKRSVVLLVDVSGSMRGERIRTAAATVGALTAEFSRDDVGVVAFWSDAAVVQPLGLPHAPGRIFDTLLRIPARGLTNVAFPLQVAQRQLAQARPREARVLLLSDCVHNAGPDPRPDAARLPRLDILLDTSGEHDAELARDLARFGRGRLAPVHSYRDVAPALAALFAP